MAPRSGSIDARRRCRAPRVIGREPLGGRPDERERHVRAGVRVLPLGGGAARNSSASSACWRSRSSVPRASGPGPRAARTPSRSSPPSRRPRRSAARKRTSPGSAGPSGRRRTGRCRAQDRPDARPRACRRRADRGPDGQEHRVEQRHLDALAEAVALARDQRHDDRDGARRSRRRSRRSGPR